MFIPVDVTFPGCYVGCMKKKILSIDIGTTSMRGILFSGDGEMLFETSRETPLHFAGDYIEQRPEVFSTALTDICRSVCGYAPPDAISLTAFRSSPTLVDRDGNALTNFIMWQDVRNRAICERLLPENDRIRALSGAGINAVFTGSKLTWLAEEMPALFREAYKAMVVPDYLICQMTGAFVTDVTYGSRTLLMNLRTQTWDETLCALFSVPREKLCSLIPQGSVAGTVRADFAAATGLTEGTPVISAGGDQQCGALGLGAFATDARVINCGTGSFLIALTDAPLPPGSPAICNLAAVPGKYIAEANVLSSAAALNWAMRTFFPDLIRDGAPDFAAFTALAASAPPGANGVRVVPLFSGCGTRDWNPDARAQIAHLSLAHTRADLARALLEGLAAEIVKSDAVLPTSGAEEAPVFLGGGLTKNDLFDQILADMRGTPLTRYPDAQATAIGAFMSAAVTLQLYDSYAAAHAAARARGEAQVFSPNASLKEIYDNVIAETEALYRHGTAAS